MAEGVSESPFRAFLFSHPDFDRTRTGSGLSLSPTGGVAMVEGHAAIRQSVLLLLSTMPGERVMRPDYGCELNRLIFHPNDATTAGLAVHYVRRAIERFEPRVEIVELTAGRADRSLRGGGEEVAASASDRLYIDLVYRVKATRWTDRITLHMSLSGD
jgi:phage baseplate assembly protein W